VLRKPCASRKVLQIRGFFEFSNPEMRTFQAARRMIVQRTKIKRSAAE
jgi:hypothetical protein